MAFDYESGTRGHYKSSDVAREYHSGFAGRLRRESVTHRVIASFERRAIAALLDRVKHTAVLDLPCGTGKLATVLAGRARRVVAADVSPDMLAIAAETYRPFAFEQLDLQEADVMQLDAQRIGTVDVAVCLRLLHRVPDDFKDRALAELLRIAPAVIVSTGIETAFHRLRRRMRGAIFGGDTSALCFEGIEAARARIARAGTLVEERWVARGLSQEVVFLVRRHAAV